jgi:hypothetical protein
MAPGGHSGNSVHGGSRVSSDCVAFNAVSRIADPLQTDHDNAVAHASATRVPSRHLSAPLTASYQPSCRAGSSFHPR